MRFRVVGANRHSFDVTGRGVGFDLIHIGASAPERPGHQVSIKFDPVIRTAEWMEQTAVVRLPMPELKIEIVLAITFGGRLGLGRRRRAGLRLGGRIAEQEYACQKADSQMLKEVHCSYSV